MNAITKQGSSIARRSALMAAVAVLAVTAVGCGGQSAESDATPSSSGSQSIEELVEAAQAEGGPVVWYTAVTTATTDALAQGFTEKYGIEVEVQRLATGALLERLAAEVSSGANLADVIEPASPTPFRDEPDWFASLSDVPGFEEYPDDFKAENNATTVISPWGITVNSDLVAEDAPQSWTDLLDPEWSGKIMLTDIRSSDNWMAWAELMRESYGIEYLEELAAMNPEISDTGSAGAAQVAAGTRYLSFPATSGNSADLRQQGAPLDFVVVEDDTSAANIFAGVSSTAPHPNAARLFLSYRMSDEAAGLVCSSANASAPIVADGCPDLPSGYTEPIFDLTEEQKNELTAALGLTS